MRPRFGVFNLVQARAGVATADLYAQSLDEAQAAEDLGFDVLWYAEHHFSAYSELPSPDVLLGAVAARTQRIRLGNMVNVLPFHNPVRVAEEAAMLDQLSRGRLDVGIGRGVQLQEFDSLQVPMGESRAIFEEALEVVLGCWRERGFSHRGRYFQCDNVRLEPGLVQQPHPPLYVTATSPVSLEWAGRRGLPFPQIFAPLRAMGANRATYRAARQSAGHPDRRDAYLPFRHVYVGASDAEARAVAEPAVREYWHLFANTVFPPPDRPLPPGYEHHEGRYALVAQSYDDMEAQGILLVGSPETVARQVQAHLDALEVDQFMGVFSFSTLQHAQVLASLRRFAEQVIPRIAAVRATSPP